MAKKGKVDRISETTTGTDTEFAASGIEGKKAQLAQLTAEHDEDLQKEKETGFLCGSILSKRRAREAAIDQLTAEIEAGSKGKSDEGA